MRSTSVTRSSPASIKDGICTRRSCRPGTPRFTHSFSKDCRPRPIADRILNLTPRPAGEEQAPQRVSLDAGEVLFRTGDRGELVYVVEDGEIEIFRERADGTEEHLDTITGGGYFGELAPLLGLPRAAAARATSRSTLTAYTVHDFRTKIRPGTVGELLAQAEDRS